MNTKSKTMKAICFALVCALASSAGSVQAWTMPKMFSLDNTWPFRDKDKPQEGTPVRMVGTWTDTVMTQAGQKPQRGFGGRILFYDKEGKKPILVEGQLVVYAFDETNRQPTDNKPTRRYVFPADQMAIHMSKCELGASYSFWLPWDEAGGPKTEVGLICRFEPKGGAVVTGEQTHHLLPGTIPPLGATVGSPKPPKVPEGVPSKPARLTLEDLQAKRNAEQQAQQTSFQAPTAGSPQGAVANAALQTGVTPDRRLSASTIALPQNYQMPDTATLNAAMQAAGYQQAAAQMSPNAGQSQMSPAQTRTYNMAAPGMTMNQPMNAQQPYMGAQLPPQQQMPAQLLPQQQLPASQPAMFPGVQAVATSPVGSNPAMGQIQQQSYQQPIMQQPMMQPLPARQPLPPMQPWTQTQNQVGPTATVNSPVSVQYR
jgi:hypothetical protein